MKKHFIKAQQLLEDSFNLAWQVCQSGYRPNHIVGVWRGGAPIGIAVQEFLDVLGVDKTGRGLWRWVYPVQLCSRTNRKMAGRSHSFYILGFIALPNCSWHWRHSGVTIFYWAKEPNRFTKNITFCCDTSLLAAGPKDHF
jgi:hypothetical protein